MSSDPFDQASTILDAAGSGTVVHGHEDIGQLLLDLRETSPVPAGAAIRSAGVAAATSASTPGAATLLVSWLKPLVIVLSAVLVSGGLMFASSVPRSSSAEIIPGPDANVGVIARVVADPSAEPIAEPTDMPTTVLDSTASSSEDPASGGSGQATASPTTAGQGSSPTADPATTTTADPVTTTTAEPATTAAAPAPTTTVGPTTTLAMTTTTTVAVPTTVPDGGGEPPPVQGNNGNGNGNGTGNGNGNNGQGSGQAGGNGDGSGESGSG